MVLPIPVDYLKEEDRQRVVRMAEASAREVLSHYVPANIIVTRTANPGDFGLTGNTFEWSLGGTGRDTIVDRELGSDEVIAIYGFTLLASTPTITRIVLKTGAETVADINIEDVHGHQVTEVLLDKPIVFTPQSRMIIEVYNTAGAATTEKMVIKAIVAEKAGKTVTKPT